MKRISSLVLILLFIVICLMIWWGWSAFGSANGISADATLIQAQGLCL